MAFTREIVDGVCVKEVPSAWKSILIYHPATDQYYATKSVHPLEYEAVLRNRSAPRYAALAISLRKLLDINSTFQFFVLHQAGRVEIEDWLASIGKRRVTTKMGQGATPDREIFEIYSPQNKLTRYVSAPFDTPATKLISQANKAMAQWLSSTSSENRQERLSMQVALRSLGKTNTKVFEDTSVIRLTPLLCGQPHNRYRTICTENNLIQIKNFILSTCF